MYDFIFAALPWIALGIAVAVIVANESNKRKSKYQSTKEVDDVNNKKDNENYATLGMILGMSLGIAIGSSFMKTFGTVALTYGISFGTLIGVLAGILFKRK